MYTPVLSWLPDVSALLESATTDMLGGLGSLAVLLVLDNAITRSYTGAKNCSNS